MAYRKRIRVGVRAAIRCLLERWLCVVVANRVRVLQESASEGRQAEGRQAKRLVCRVHGGGEFVTGQIDEPGTASDEVGLLASGHPSQPILLFQMG